MLMNEHDPLAWHPSLFPWAAPYHFRQAFPWAAPQRLHMQRAAGMRTDTHTQQQLTMRAINNPKSWTAGICTKQKGQNWREILVTVGYTEHIAVSASAKVCAYCMLGKGARWINMAPGSSPQLHHRLALWHTNRSIKLWENCHPQFVLFYNLYHCALAPHCAPLNRNILPLPL